MIVRIKELQDDHVKLKRDLTKGKVEVCPVEYARLFDKHTKILKAFELLEKAYLMMNGIKKRGYHFLEFKEEHVEIILGKEASEH